MASHVPRKSATGTRLPDSSVRVNSASSGPLPAMQAASSWRVSAVKETLRASPFLEVSITHCPAEQIHIANLHAEQFRLAESVGVAEGQHGAHEWFFTLCGQSAV